MANPTNEYPIRVYYEDTDAGGIVYHANYLKFFERARTEMLRTLGINQSTFLVEKFAMVVKKMTIDYCASAQLDDALTVTTQVSELKRASLAFKQTISNEDGKCICTADVLIACVNLTTSRPCAIPKVIVGAFNGVS